MGVDAQVNFEVVPWDDTAERELGQIADAADHIESWRLAWKEGRAQLWSINAQTVRVGCVLWEVVMASGDPQIHVLAAATTDQTCSTTGALYRAFAALRQGVNAACVYCETMRPGLVRLLTAQGCEAAQIAPGKWGVRHV